MTTPDTSPIQRSGRGWGYLGALLGGLVSIGANTAHSYVPPADVPAGWRPPLGAVIGAIFWPVALFVAIEILARTDWPSGARWVFVRFLGLVPVAVVAAIVSYNHLSGLLAHYGEDRLTTVIGPLAVDGLMVMSSAAVMATTPRRLPDIETAPDPVTVPDIVEAEDEPDGPDECPDEEPDTAADTKPRRKSAPRRRRTTAEKVAALADKHPDMTPLEMAKKLKVTDRTVRRYLPVQQSAPSDVPDVEPAAA